MESLIDFPWLLGNVLQTMKILADSLTSPRLDMLTSFRHMISQVRFLESLFIAKETSAKLRPRIQHTCSIDKLFVYASKNNSPGETLV